MLGQLQGFERFGVGPDGLGEFVFRRFILLCSRVRVCAVAI